MLKLIKVLSPEDCRVLMFRKEVQLLLGKISIWIMETNIINRSTTKIFFIVRKNRQLLIGSNIGMSSTAIICDKHIQIGNFVKIGGNIWYWFPFIDVRQRKDQISDYNNNRQDVIIENNVFIGAHSTILKGIRIGENSVMGACSVVTKSISKNEIWGGNPAKFIRTI